MQKCCIIHDKKVTYNLNDIKCDDLIDLIEKYDLIETSSVLEECSCNYRTLIAVMIFFTAWVSYSTRASQTLSITAMTLRTGKNVIPECKREDSDNKNKSENATTQKPKDLPDHGPRYDWSETIQSVVLGSYFYGFFAASLPSGTIAEWVGPFWTIFTGMCITLVCNIASPFLADIHVGALIGCRVVMGLANAFMYPSMQVLIARWAPPQEKGKFVSALLGNMLGNAVTYWAVGFFTEKFNWYWGYHFVSCEIVLYLIAFFFIVSDSPEQNKWIKKEEVEFIKTSQEGRITKTKAVPPYLKILCSAPFWGIVLAEYGNLWGIYLQLSGVPKFLVEVVGFDIENSGFLASLPYITRLVCGLFFGNLTDWLVRSGRMSKRVIRRGFVLFSHFIPGSLMILLWAVGCNGTFIIVLLTFSMGFSGAVVATHLQNHLELSPNFAGTLYAMHAFFGGTTGFLTPVVTSLFIENNNGITEWGYVFLIGGGFYISTGIFFILVVSTEVQPWNEKKKDMAEAAT